jgi:NitT/TauT family transport system substrate-binding protein
MLAALAVLAVACGSGGAPSTPGAPETAAEAQEDETTATGTQEAVPAEPVTIRYVYCAETLASSGAPFWIGQELGFFEEEGIAVEMLTASGGTGQCMQMLAAGQVDISAPGPEVVLGPVAQGQQIDATYFYEVSPEVLLDTAVPVDSPIQGYEDLAGAVVGTGTAGGSMQIFAEAGLRDAGLEPTAATFVTASTGAAAAESLAGGEIDALVLNDVRFAALEAAGYEFRYLPRPELTERMFGAGLLARNDWLEENPEAAAGYARAYTRSVIFTRTNPEAAIRLHWEMFPQFRPQGDEAEALRVDRAILDRRLSSTEGEGTEENPWGVFDDDAWTAYAEFLGVGAQIPDLTEYYTNEFAEQVGDVDEEAVEALAEDYEA